MAHRTCQPGVAADPSGETLICVATISAFWWFLVNRLRATGCPEEERRNYQEQWGRPPWVCLAGSHRRFPFAVRVVVVAGSITSTVIARCNSHQASPTVNLQPSTFPGRYLTFPPRTVYLFRSRMTFVAVQTCCCCPTAREASRPFTGLAARAHF